MTALGHFPVRTLQTVDAELQAQVKRRGDAINELLHALFAIERSTIVIDRLIDERCGLTARATGVRP